MGGEMSLAKQTLIGLVVATLVPHLQASRNIFGSCPQVTPQENFNMTRFEGVWYVAEVFDERVRCMEWNITPQGDNVWHIKETKDSGIVGEYNGRLTLDKETPAALTVTWSANIGGGYPFTVFTTDYDNYAGVFLCQKVWFYSRQEGVVLSRTPIMHISLRQQTRGMASKFGIDMSYFKKVDQGNCQRNLGPKNVTRKSSPNDVYDYILASDY